ncbi:MAG: HAMP domain-containing sensor histidine kinase [Enhygromyxa sp.]
MSLRKTVVTLTIVVTVIAVLVAAALFVLTTSLHRTTANAAESAENVRLALQAQIALTEHARAKDLIHQRSTANEIRARLLRASSFVGSEQERRILDKAEQRLETYLASYRDSSRTAAEVMAAYGAAYGALGELVDINVIQSKEAQDHAGRWNEIANVIAVVATVLLLLLAAALLVWLKARAFAPIFELAATMNRFGRGDHSAVAVERGPRELREMCRHFNEMAAAIAAQRKAQTAFLAGVAHDLRTPLSALQMGIVLLLRDPSHSSNEQLRSALERIARQIKRMDRMLGDFLDGAKIEAGLLELRVEIHDARELVAEVVDLFEGMSEHRFELRLPDEAVPICCDRLRIEQVVTNLISNAIKYSPSDSVVEVTLRPGPKQVELRVSDQGVGISEQSLSRLFEPFSRVGLSSEAVPGVGLGLFVVRRIVEAHGGRIEVESAPGQGSTFKVLLPRSEVLRGRG